MCRKGKKKIVIRSVGTLFFFILINIEASNHHFRALDSSYKLEP